MEFSVRDAVEYELEALPEAARKSTLAVTALRLANELDGDSQFSPSGTAKELRETMAKLHDIAAPVKGDGVDELAARRDARSPGAAST